MTNLDAIKTALETDEFDRTPEQQAIAVLHSAAHRALWEIEAGHMKYDNRRANVVNVLKNVVVTDG